MLSGVSKTSRKGVAVAMVTHPSLPVAEHEAANGTPKNRLSRSVRVTSCSPLMREDGIPETEAAPSTVIVSPGESPWSGRATSTSVLFSVTLRETQLSLHELFDEHRARDGHGCDLELACALTLFTHRLHQGLRQATGCVVSVWDRCGMHAAVSRILPAESVVVSADHRSDAGQAGARQLHSNDTRLGRKGHSESIGVWVNATIPMFAVDAQQALVHSPLLRAGQKNCRTA